MRLDLPEQLCHERNANRPDRNFDPHVVKRHTQALRRSLKGLYQEGFHRTYILDSIDRIESVKIDRQPLWNNRHRSNRSIRACKCYHWGQSGRTIAATAD